MSVNAWCEALQERHRSAFTSAEFLKAVRALSARYVERRATLPSRSPLDSAGKRAAFAAFYAPLHFLTTQEIIRALFARSRTGLAHAGETRPLTGALTRIFDLGCGTGVAGAAWALEQPTPPKITGVDSNAWALDEARWNVRQLGLTGDFRRGDLVRAAEQLLSRERRLSSTGIVCGWSVNELPAPARAPLLRALVESSARGAFVLVIEPIARSAAPWWDEWTSACSAAGGESREWRFQMALPEVLRALDEEAGFRRESLTARSLFLRAPSPSLPASPA